MRIVSDYFLGFFAPVRAGVFILKNPKIWPTAVVPIMINLVLYFLFFRYGSQFIDTYVHNAVEAARGWLPEWATFLVPVFSFLLAVLKWILLGLFALLSFTVVSGLIASPFNDHLSKSTAKILQIKQLTAQKEIVFLNLPLSKTFSLEIKRMGILIIGAVFALLLGFIPLINILALALGALLVSFEYFGYPISHVSERLGSVWKFTLVRFAQSLGFGSFFLLLMALPFTAIIYIPLAVVGSTLLFYRSTGNTHF